MLKYFIARESWIKPSFISKKIYKQVHKQLPWIEGIFSAKEVLMKATTLLYCFTGLLYQDLFAGFLCQ